MSKKNKIYSHLVKACLFLKDDLYGVEQIQHNMNEFGIRTEPKLNLKVLNLIWVVCRN